MSLISVSLRLSMIVCAAVVGVLRSDAVEFAVKPRTCYEVAYRVRVVDGPSVEQSPLIGEILPVCVSRNNAAGVKFAGVQWRFKDAAGRTIARPIEGASPQSLFTRGWKTYRYRFWTPENAARFSIFISGGSKGNKAELTDVNISEISSPKTLNFNSDFSAADDAAPGWQLVGSAAFQNYAVGASQVNALDGHVNSDLFPVNPGSSIKVTAKCAAAVMSVTSLKNTNVRIEFYSSYIEAAKKGVRKNAYAEKVLSSDGDSDGISNIYRVPDGKRWARVSAWRGIVKEITVTTVEEGGAE